MGFHLYVFETNADSQRFLGDFPFMKMFLKYFVEGLTSFCSFCVLLFFDCLKVIVKKEYY